ncbi:MAG: hypothetical protein EXR07_00500 [Acetobacteraceae bacterium]|nr:hypothetical protein [Acetobacteraceae bacterium]
MRGWLAAELRHQAPRLPGGEAIAARFGEFQDALPAIRGATDREAGKLAYPEYCEIASDWLIEDERRRTSDRGS